MTRCDAAGGFSLLEALLALTILAAALLPLFAVQQGATRAAAAVERAQTRAELDRAVLARLRTLNPLPAGAAMAPDLAAAVDGSRRGAFDAAGARVRWVATPTAPARRAVNAGTGTAARFLVQPFHIAARIERPGHPPRTWTVAQLGWRPLTSVNMSF
ncbi:hypothetical protein EV659_10861 [Rhodothalassium salexigens DSM 2132]|uniref:Prepilin-type N-terminal cleavage/methylation domain-containing protein n=1 Tax=Rhodothalassium salexigens DSM 2132 TaxID=1188247 RepID=A0A4R2PCU5_RHOSA|nr:hypothetical protein [Rhodothalassium salexigens]MBB4212087.1 Tfp pilus assembly protein PilV [Rhodothalassium salexigens DSM 2132]MBK1638304.1 hypothetical protein [Rhodothalassium salexigens DSM 2132]TCP32962.1 hypothetical protein EV659_10861 [Rhodothalassium salexigens DSM 2132]